MCVHVGVRVCLCVCMPAHALVCVLCTVARLHVYLHRCWAVVREKEGQLLMLSQTQYPKLAAVRPQLQPTSDGKMELHITAPDMSPIIVPEELPPSASTAVVRCVQYRGFYT